jgi:hypothetical protein
MESYYGGPALDRHSNRVGEFTILGEAGTECFSVLCVRRPKELIDQSLQSGPVRVGHCGLGEKW